MKPRIRSATLILSAAAISAAAAIGSAQATDWLPSGLLSRLTGQTSQQPPAATAPAGNGPAAADKVQVTVQGGRVVAVDVPVYPADRRASQRINSRALPMLESEVISAQSARVNIISGATLTSDAYLRSLNAALGNAGSGI